MDVKTQRSWLVVPMSKPDAVAQAAKSAADVIVLDLVEFVRDEQKLVARESIRAAISVASAGGAQVFAQIDPQNPEADLRACVWPGLSGVVVSRAESAAQIEAIDKNLLLLEKERNLPANSMGMVLALETARGNQDAYAIATASTRVRGLTLGRADLVMDLRPEPSGEIHLMPYLMERLVILARTIGVTPLGAWWRAPDRGLLATAENTLQAAQRGRAVGFKGALCLRAEQIAPLNKIYA
ncbi:MAG: aldolase/citrate lyase family protein [Burkholderiales bacterium]